MQKLTTQTIRYKHIVLGAYITVINFWSFDTIYGFFKTFIRLYWEIDVKLLVQLQIEVFVWTNKGGLAKTYGLILF